MELKDFYCYTKDNKRVVVDEKPENFDSLKNKFKTPPCPNSYVAGLLYKTKIKFKECGC